MPTFWIIFWIACFCRGRTKFFSFPCCRRQTEPFFFPLPFGISLFVCLLIWNTVFWSVWIWSCSEEVEARVWKIVFWSVWLWSCSEVVDVRVKYGVCVLGFAFFCFVFFFFFFVWDKRLDFFIDERLMKVSLSKRTVWYFKELTLHVSVF